MRALSAKTRGAVGLLVEPLALMQPTWSSPALSDSVALAQWWPPLGRLSALCAYAREAGAQTGVVTSRVRSGGGDIGLVATRH